MVSWCSCPGSNSGRTLQPTQTFFLVFWLLYVGIVPEGDLMAIFVCDRRCKFLLMFLFVTEKKGLVTSFGCPPGLLKCCMFWYFQKSFTKTLFSSLFLQCRWGCLYNKFRSLFSLPLYNRNRNPTDTGALAHRYHTVWTGG
jgi:hypothetical protein